jgi:hypothetical protein
MFSLVSSRYERASLIVTSNKPFSAWGEIFRDGRPPRPRARNGPTDYPRLPLARLSALRSRIADTKTPVARPIALPKSLPSPAWLRQRGSHGLRPVPLSRDVRIQPGATAVRFQSAFTTKRA